MRVTEKVKRERGRNEERENGTGNVCVGTGKIRERVIKRSECISFYTSFSVRLKNKQIDKKNFYL